MLAIIKTGGKEYKVDLGASLHVEKLEGEAGDEVDFGEALLVQDGEKTEIGTPFVAGVSVGGKIIRQYRGDKIIVFKHKRRKTYKRKNGHRQNLTEVVITRIGDKKLELAPSSEQKNGETASSENEAVAANE